MVINFEYIGAKHKVTQSSLSHKLLRGKLSGLILAVRGLLCFHRHLFGATIAESIILTRLTGFTSVVPNYIKI